MSTSIQIASFSFAPFRSVIFVKVFSQSRNSKAFGLYKTNGIHNSSDAIGAHSLDLMWRKWILRSVEWNDVEQLPTLIVRPSAARRSRCNFPLGHIVAWMRTARPNKINGFSIDGTKIAKTKDATQRKRNENTFGQSCSCWVTNLLACILCKSVLVGLSECLAKCSLLFIFAAVLCANNSTNRHTPFAIGRPIHRKRKVVSAAAAAAAKGGRRVPGPPLAHWIRNHFRESYYRALERRRWRGRGE